MYRLFGGMPNAKADYTNVPTVVFSHPVIGTIGLTEEEAKEQYGAEKLKIYNSSFVNLWYVVYACVYTRILTYVLCYLYHAERAWLVTAVYITHAVHCLSMCHYSYSTKSS